MNDALEHFRFHEAAHVVYHFFWGDFCDWYIEWVKPELLSADRAKATATWKNLFAAFESALRLLHPFMPFLTEELWHQLPQRAGARSIALDRFPEPHAERIDAAAEEQIALAAGNHHGGAQHSSGDEARPEGKNSPRNWRRHRRLCNPSSKTVWTRFCGWRISLPFPFAKPPFDSTKGVIRSTKDFELFIAYEAAVRRSGRSSRACARNSTASRRISLRSSSAWRTRRFAAARRSTS